MDNSRLRITLSFCMLTNTAQSTRKYRHHDQNRCKRNKTLQSQYRIIIVSILHMNLTQISKRQLIPHLDIANEYRNISNTGKNNHRRRQQQTWNDQQFPDHNGPLLFTATQAHQQHINTASSRPCQYQEPLPNAMQHHSRNPPVCIKVAHRVRNRILIQLPIIERISIFDGCRKQNRYHTQREHPQIISKHQKQDKRHISPCGGCFCLIVIEELEQHNQPDGEDEHDEELEAISR
mmetsp:Transcript_62820/g.99750  ORF Transcript_62820/g.99750 Transcript_62820/m.99750 type:complete len:235 (+) Transcript_62820:208-912(+)